MRTRPRHTRFMDVDDSFEKAGRCFDVAQHLNHPAVVRAFQRRWRPLRVNGEGDVETITLAHAVAAMSQGGTEP